MREFILLHYDEICLKGGNRGLFEQKLAANARKSLGSTVSELVPMHGRMVARLAKGADFEKARRRLSLLPGIANFSRAISVPLEMGEIRDGALSLLGGREFSTFRVSTRRANKRFPLDSHGVDCDLGEFICGKTGKKVSLEHPGITLHAEICDREAFLYTEQHDGIGGLPVGSSAPLVCSLSGGIDSPVSAFMMMKRGCPIVFAHAHNKSIGATAVKGKLSEIVSRLTEVQLSSKLYIVPFEKLQKEIIICVPAKLRMVAYRRAMMKVMNRVARLERAPGIVTGDSVGQVASQTLENLNCIYRASELPVFAPLAGMNKAETTLLARKIGTYEASIVQSPDCCSFMIAQHPETRATLAEIEAAEGSIPVQELAEKAVEESEILTFEAE